MIEAECKISYKDLNELEEKARAFDQLMSGEKSDYVLISKGGYDYFKVYVHKKPDDTIAMYVLDFYHELKSKQ